MFITSPAFNNQETIPRKFTCSGGDINPELQIQNVPTGAKSLVLIVDDPDAPGGIFTHWTIWNIGSKTTVVKEESKPPSAVEGTTDFGRIGWGGPCPPPGTPHRYFFRLYAVDTLLDLPAGASRKQLEHAMEGHVLQAAELMGIFSR
ncbi:MAG: YbhB/YbcL family Raf kinase inhibitor-like protein [Candidatus Liptonbacteria bacterium]|nr:YbhB/YbcL family Raf kinase inhibitor-like protein [Candidatus Liptonbacteria bacterium]